MQLTPKKILIAVVLAFALVGIGALLPVNTRPQPVHADFSDKYDGDCTGTETAGRCADKCPANTSEGVYYLQGYDQDTGAAVCGFSYYHECPYAAAQSADSAVCQKLTADQAQPVQATTPPAAVSSCEGK